MDEVWRPVVGWEGLYEVSNLGRVISLERNINRGNVVQHREKRFLIPRKNVFGYMQAKLSRNGTSRRYMIHRLVGEAFIPNPNKLPFINHKDEVKDHNYVYINKDGSVDPQKSNLEWCTRLYNVRYGNCREKMRISHINHQKLSRKCAKCTMSGEIIEIYPSQAEAARKNGLSQGRISNCCKNKPKCVTHGGFKWIYI